YLPFMLFENAQFILLRILRGASNISMTLFTLLISPFMLSIALATYNSYVNSGYLNRQKGQQKIKLGYLGKKLWHVLEMVFEFVHILILKARTYLKTFIVLTLIIIIGLSVYSEERGKPIVDEQ